jgi:hypothetical protein
METNSQPRLSDDRVHLEEERQSACAYVLVIPRIEGPVLETLQKLLAALSTQEPVALPIDPRKAQLEVMDSWLSHSAAAKHLGISESTLYRYAEHRILESRKLCGRLQYRLSSLDKFKDQQVRRAHRSLTDRAILPNAPTSGK